MWLNRNKWTHSSDALNDIWHVKLDSNRWCVCVAHEVLRSTHSTGISLCARPIYCRCQMWIRTLDLACKFPTMKILAKRKRFVSKRHCCTRAAKANAVYAFIHSVCRSAVVSPTSFIRPMRKQSSVWYRKWPSIDHCSQAYRMRAMPSSMPVVIYSVRLDLLRMWNRWVVNCWHRRIYRCCRCTCWPCWNTPHSVRAPAPDWTIVCSPCANWNRCHWISWFDTFIPICIIWTACLRKIIIKTMINRPNRHYCNYLPNCKYSDFNCIPHYVAPVDLCWRKFLFSV